MKLEPLNIVCPKCGKAGYMRHLVGEGVGKIDVKCINCNSYYYSSELYKLPEKKQTNADRIRQMSDEELANFIGFVAQDAFCYGRGMRDKMLIYPQFGEYDTTIKWLKEEATE